YRRFFVIDTLEHASVMGVHFRPGGASRVLGIPAGALADSHVALEALWGRSARDLRARLCAASTPAQRFEVLEEALTARLSRPSKSHGAVRFALGALERAPMRITELARSVNLSHRRFIDVFTSAVGMTPKLFARVRRFQRAAELARHKATPDWVQLALDCGYCDQSHMIRDFVAFSGFSPAQLRRLGDRPVKESHVALPTW